MKKLFLIIFLFCCVFNSGYTQIQREVEERVGNNVYRIIYIDMKVRTDIWIERATDSLRHLGPGFKWSKSMNFEYDRDKVEQLVKEYIVPTIKQSEFNFKDSDDLSMTCIFDMDGNIREFSIDFPDKLKIPMEVVDTFFNAVLSSGLKATFKKDHYGLKNANFMYDSRTFRLKQLQEK